MTRELTPWEKLDGIKHSLNFIGNSLDSIIEGAVEWERSRIIKLLEKNLESWEECIVFRKTYDTANVPSLIALIKEKK